MRPAGSQHRIMPSPFTATHLTTARAELPSAAAEIRAWRARISDARDRTPWSSPAARAFDVALAVLLGQFGKLGTGLDEAASTWRQHSQRAGRRAAELRRLPGAAVRVGEHWLGLR